MLRTPRVALTWTSTWTGGSRPPGWWRTTEATRASEPWPPAAIWTTWSFCGSPWTDWVARGEADALDRAWLSMHNYMFNHPLDYAEDSNGYLKFRWYDRIIREKLGRPMPIIGTEGGAYPGAHEDKRFPPLSEAEQVRRVVDAYRYMDRREPYYFAYSYWIIANEEGGGYDRAFTDHALFKSGGRVSPIVSALKALAAQGRGKEVKH